MLEKKGLSKHKSPVICFNYQSISWACEPLQSIADVHMRGHKAGGQAGDIMYSLLNLQMFIVTQYIAGKNISIIQKAIQDFFKKRINTNKGALILLYSQCIALKEGLQILDTDRIGNIPTERALLSRPKVWTLVLITSKIYQLIRAYLFRKLDDISPDVVNVSEVIREIGMLRPVLLMGIWFEGLASYEFARETNETEKWMKKGGAVLAKMKHFSEHSLWNFENKMLLLEAEKMRTLRDFDKAESFYERAIQSAHEHKFIHEEAIASELAGLFHYERRNYKKSSAFLMHSVRSYEKWGARAVARRVENFISSSYGPELLQRRPNYDLSGNI